MSPRSGRYTPATRLNKVVLPAPFGPMSAVMLCPSTEKLAPSTARRPRNALLTSSTSSRGTSEPSRLEAESAGQRRPHPVRQVDGDQQQEQPMNDLPGAGQVDAGLGQNLG